MKLIHFVSLIENGTRWAAGVAGKKSPRKPG